MIEKNENTSDITEYGKDIEDLFISFMMTKPDLFVRCKGIINSSYFDDKQNRDTVAFIESYSTDYTVIPTLDVIKAITKKDIEIFSLTLTKPSNLKCIQKLQQKV